MVFHHDLSAFGTLFSTTAAAMSPMRQATILPPLHDDAPALRARSSGAVDRFFALLLTWSERARQRRALAGMSARMLADIGAGREEAMVEARKPFWRV